MMQRTVVPWMVLGVLALGAGGASGQERNRDWEERLEAQMERMAHRLERVGRVIDRTVSRSVERALDRGVRIEWDEDWEWDQDWDAFEDSDRSWDEEDRGPFSAQEEFSWEGDLSAGQTVEIRGVNGAVLAEPGVGSRVEVVAEKRGRRDSPGDVRIEVLEHRDGVTVCAVYPPGRRGRENRCEAGTGGRLSSHDNDVQVTFRVKVPEGVHFVGRTINGRVEVQDLTGDVTAYTVNGSVELSTLGEARAKTVNGSIRATLGRLTRPAEFKTVNGSIELDLPDRVDAEIDAHWLSGGIESALPLTIRGRLGRRSAKGVLGSGGPVVALSTVNGSIRIR